MMQGLWCSLTFEDWGLRRVSPAPPSSGLRASLASRLLLLLLLLRLERGQGLRELRGQGQGQEQGRVRAGQQKSENYIPN